MYLFFNSFISPSNRLRKNRTKNNGSALMPFRTFHQETVAADAYLAFALSHILGRQADSIVNLLIKSLKIYGFFAGTDALCMDGDRKQGHRY